MKPNQDLIIRVLTDARGKSISLDELLSRARLDIGSKPRVKQLLRELAKHGQVEEDGRLYRLAVKKPEVHEVPEVAENKSIPKSKTAFSAVPAMPASVLPLRPKDGSGEVVGTLTIARGGFGFVASLHGGEDVFVPAFLLNEALDGDLVRVKIVPGRDGRTAAGSMELVERRRSVAIGTYRHPGGRDAWVEPRDEALGPAIVVPASPLVKDGDIVRVSLGERRRGPQGPEQHGTVIGRVGLPGDADVEVLETAYSHGFSDVFPPDVLAAANEIPELVQPGHREGRRDLTTLDLVTIDGEDARDFDDAIFVEQTPHGFRLVVAIADVTAYVTEGGALDREAQRRATSVYFPGHVLPMLPERLSNGICSLNPHVERLCMVADMALDSSGQPLNEEIYPAVMNSRARCTYTQVAKLLDGTPVPGIAHVSAMIGTAGELAKRMTGFRMRRGAIDFDIREGQIILDKEGAPAAIVRRARNSAYRLVEEFMLAANEAVARYFEARDLPTVFRIHAHPDERKLEEFRTLARLYGHDVKSDDNGRVSASELNAFLKRIEGRPEQRALNQLLLRSMMRAVYSSENVGHYGLAAESYLHFTSPIRRYPDLIVHRLLKEHWARAGRVPSVEIREKQGETLEAVAAHCSERERASTEAERDIDAYYAARLMVDRVGEHFKGVIAGVADFGLFIELEDPAVEGLVPAEAIVGGELDEERRRVRIGDKWIGVGDTVEVEITAVDILQRRIQLAFVGELQGARRARGPAALAEKLKARSSSDVRPVRKPFVQPARREEFEKEGGGPLLKPGARRKQGGLAAPRAGHGHKPAHGAPSKAGKFGGGKPGGGKFGGGKPGGGKFGGKPGKSAGGGKPGKGGGKGGRRK